MLHAEGDNPPKQTQLPDKVDAVPKFVMLAKPGGKIFHTERNTFSHSNESPFYNFSFKRELSPVSTPVKEVFEIHHKYAHQPPEPLDREPLFQLEKPGRVGSSRLFSILRDRDEFYFQPNPMLGTVEQVPMPVFALDHRKPLEDEPAFFPDPPVLTGKSTRKVAISAKKKKKRRIRRGFKTAYFTANSEEELVKNTLSGFLIEHIGEHGPCAEEELLAALHTVYGKLRRSSGHAYGGDMLRSLRSALSANDLFERELNGKWRVRQKEAGEFVNCERDKFAKLKEGIAGKKRTYPRWVEALGDDLQQPPQPQYLISEEKEDDEEEADEEEQGVDGSPHIFELNLPNALN